MDLSNNRRQPPGGLLVGHGPPLASVQHFPTRYQRSDTLVKHALRIQVQVRRPGHPGALRPDFSKGRFIHTPV